MKLKQTLILIFAILLTVVTSCKTAVPQGSKETVSTITITEVVHDTVFTIQKDSSSYKALLECREGKVVIKTPIKATAGKVTEKPKVLIQNNELSVDCETKAQELFAQWKSQDKHEKIAVTERIPYPVEKQLTFWQKLLIVCGKIFLTLVVLACITFILKLKNIV